MGDCVADERQINHDQRLGLRGPAQHGAGSVPGRAQSAHVTRATIADLPNGVQRYPRALEARVSRALATGSV